MISQNLPGLVSRDPPSTQCCVYDLDYYIRLILDFWDWSILYCDLMRPFENYSPHGVFGHLGETLIQLRSSLQPRVTSTYLVVEARIG